VRMGCQYILGIEELEMVSLGIKSRAPLCDGVAPNWSRSCEPKAAEAARGTSPAGARRVRKTKAKVLCAKITQNAMVVR